MNQPQIGLMVLCHKRHQVLPLIVEQVATDWPGSVVHFTLDRPTEGVKDTVSDLCHRNPTADYRWAPFPALTPREQFVALRQYQLQEIQRAGPVWISLWDDDHVLEWPEQAKAALEADKADLYYITKRYFWDSFDYTNEGLPAHNSILFFRNVPGQRWQKMVMAPSPLHETGRSAQLAGGLLDIGYMLPPERDRVWEAYKRAGKIDQLTLGLTQEPRRELFRSNSPWYKKLREVYA